MTWKGDKDSAATVMQIEFCWCLC